MLQRLMQFEKENTYVGCNGASSKGSHNNVKLKKSTPSCIAYYESKTYIHA